MSATEDDVQLGCYDVPAQVLAADGVPLVYLVGEQGAASVDTLLGPPPVDGWRVIAAPFPPPPGELSILAAPWADRRSNGWMLVTFTSRDGRWTACIEEDRRPVRPGRKHRRAALQLQWAATPVVAPAGTVPVLRLALRNIATEPWRTDGIDSGHVRAWALGPDSVPLSPKPWPIEAIPCRPLSHLDPGASTELSATWDTDIAALSPGEYQIAAELTDLRLRCDLGTLRLT